MKRLLKITLLLTTFLLPLVAILSMALSEPVAFDPSEYAAMPITTHDGDVVPLGGLIEHLERKAEEIPIEKRVTSETIVVDEGSTPEEVMKVITRNRRIDEPMRQLVRLAQDAYRDGRLTEAKALLASVPPGDRQYSRAQRYLGWEVLTERGAQPRAGLAHIHRALKADPLDGENWQDGARVFLASIGVPYDPVHNSWHDD